MVRLSGAYYDERNCRLCPRRCGADRTAKAGRCGGGNRPKVAKAMLHMWEEPCISGTRGAGAVFFSGCPLRCIFCQNAHISRDNFGREITTERLAEIFGELEKKGAHNIDLVSPTHYAPYIREAMDMADVTVPYVYNSGGYDGDAPLDFMEGKVKIFLPDLKYMSSEASARLSGAPDYFEVAKRTIGRMVKIAGRVETDGDGLLKKGVVIRHLVLPGMRHDSIALMRWIKAEFGDDVLVSIMSQYTPVAGVPREINRKLTTFEYKSVTDVAEDLGIRGYTQERTSAKEEYTPDFDLSGV